MDEEQFRAAMEMENPTIEYIESIAVEKKRKSEEENKTAHENNAKAKEEEKRKEAEEKAKKREALEKDGKFPVDDFFSSVFTVPEDFDESENSDDENDGGDDKKQ